MKKIKISFSFFILVLLCIISKNFIILINYLLALTLHELAHCFMAASRGYKLSKIKLGLFGMSIDLDLPLDDKDNFWVNIAGPICNLFICLICLAIYWLIPSSFFYLDAFCIANLTLAIFNLIPIYPLDGGKIFSNLFNDKKAYKHINFIIKIILISLSILLAYFNIFNSRLMFAIASIYFIFSDQNNNPSFVFYKKSKPQTIQKIDLIKVEENLKLYELIKLLKTKKYTIFYCENLNQRYFNQDDLISISLRYPLTTQIKDCKI